MNLQTIVLLPQEDQLLGQWPATARPELYSKWHKGPKRQTPCWVSASFRHQLETEEVKESTSESSKKPLEEVNNTDYCML